MSRVFVIATLVVIAIGPCAWAADDEPPYGFTAATSKCTGDRKVSVPSPIPRSCAKPCSD